MSTLLALLGVAGASGLGVSSAQAESASLSTTEPAQVIAQTCQVNGHELCDPNSKTVVVNKLRPLNPKSYQPTLVTTDMPLSPQTTPGSEETQIRPVTSRMLDLMYFQAKLEGIDLTFRSGYRSEVTQASVYNSFLAEGGQTYADTYVARPGYSEHQTGLSADINIGIQNGDPKANAKAAAGYRWIAENAHRFGFIVRYQQGNKPVTGFNPEPWHVRYVGDIAPKVGNTPLETFFGLPPAPDYAVGTNSSADRVTR